MISPISQHRESDQIGWAASKLNYDTYTTVTALSNMLEAAQLSYINSSSKLWDSNQKNAKIANLVCQVKGKAQDEIDLGG